LSREKNVKYYFLLTINEPIPFFTEDLGDLGTASIPMLLDSGLDQLKVVLGDSSFSDGNGQHSY